MSTKNRQMNSKISMILGFIFLIGGILCIVIAFISLFSVFFNFYGGSPSLIFLFFIGAPFVFIGNFFIRVSLHGSNKSVGFNAPNNVVDEQSGNASEELSRTIGSVFTSGIDDSAKKDKPICKRCGTVNELGAKFCDNCGAKLYNSCSNCGEDNDIDARYCRKCGKAL